MDEMHEQGDHPDARRRQREVLGEDERLLMEDSGPRAGSHHVLRVRTVEQQRTMHRYETGRRSRTDDEVPVLFL
jgi:hypothetical protein